MRQWLLLAACVGADSVSCFVVSARRIIHWGSRGRRGYHTPRLAVSWGCADDAYEPSYFDRAHLPFPPMELRAALACGQVRHSFVNPPQPYDTTVS